MAPDSPRAAPRTTRPATCDIRAHAPFAREVDLEHVAGAKVVVDARDAVEECVRRILLDIATPAVTSDRRRIEREIVGQRIEQCLAAGSATSRVDMR